MTRLLPGLAAFAAAMLVALLGLYAQAGTPEPREKESRRGVVKLRLLGVNDFHGHLEPPRPGIGGAAWLKSHLDRATLPGRTIRVHAGDMVGATPLISSWFHDEPTIEAANEIGFDVGTVGNHEFDEGGDELMRLLRGGRRTGPEALKPDVTGQLVNTSSPEFAGAGFPYIAANTVDRDGELLLPPFQIVERAGVRVGFIGVTTRSTPTFLLERHAARFRFTDISEAVNRWVPELRRRGVEAIVVLAHAGGPTQDETDAPDYVGEIIDEAREMSSAVDVVVAGHSHSRINVRVPNCRRLGRQAHRRGALVRRGLRPGGHPRRHADRRGGVQVGGYPGHRSRRGGGRRRRGGARRALPRAGGAACEPGGRRGARHRSRAAAASWDSSWRVPSGRSRGPTWPWSSR